MTPIDESNLTRSGWMADSDFRGPARRIAAARADAELRRKCQAMDEANPGGRVSGGMGTRGSRGRKRGKRLVGPRK